VTRAIEDFAERLKNNMPEYIVGIDRGGAIAAGLLAKRLRFHRDCPKLRLIHRADKHECGFASGIIEDELKGKSVLVVDDACRRGDTMAGALGYIEKTLQPAQVRTFVILLVKGNRATCPDSGQNRLPRILYHQAYCDPALGRRRSELVDL
jgi:hypoxanthine phosphoribosyltransferase